MVEIRPFKGLRAKKEIAEKIASFPYDVINSQEAREIARGNPYSFLHIVKPEIDLPDDIDVHDDKVYQKAKENLAKFISEGWLVQDEKPLYYIYKQKMGKHEQYGIVAGASTKDYQDDKIKKHELTRQDKEEDRVKHVYTLNANTGPVFITYQAKKEINDFVNDFVKKNDPEYDFRAEDGIAHTFWLVNKKEDIDFITKTFAKIPYTYIADGHHRSASGARVAEMKGAENPEHKGNEEYNYFLSVIFPHDQMKILDYNRAVKDLNGLTEDDFVKKVSEKFDVEKVSEKYKPQKEHEIGMYLKGQWYELTAKPELVIDDPVEKLDVQILYNNILAPLIAIGDSRTDERISFIGGIRGLEELERVVDNGDYAVTFAMYPTSIEELMAIADAGKIMPPKSTWFEPKLRSGLVTHLLD